MAIFKTIDYCAKTCNFLGKYIVLNSVNDLLYIHAWWSENVYTKFIYCH